MMRQELGPGWKRTSWIAWGGWILSALLWLFLAPATISNPLLVIALFITVAGGLGICTILLVLCYRRITGTWGSVGLWVVLLFVMFGAQNLSLPAFLDSLRMMILIVALVAVPTSVVLLLIHRDDGATIVGLGSLAVVWGMLFAASRHGDLVMVFAGTAVWWFQTLLCLFWLTVPVGCLAFLVHLCRLVVKEIWKLE